MIGVLVGRSPGREFGSLRRLHRAEKEQHRYSRGWPVSCTLAEACAGRRHAARRLGRPPVHHAAVVVDGNRIVAAGLASETPIPQDALVIDTSGRTMMPGLIEAHAHLFILGH